MTLDAIKKIHCYMSKSTDSDYDFNHHKMEEEKNRRKKKAVRKMVREQLHETSYTEEETGLYII